MTPTNPRPTKSERRAAARAQAQALREEQAQREKRAKVTRRALMGVGVLAVAGVGGGMYVASRSEGTSSDGTVSTERAGSQGVPAVVAKDGSWSFGKDLTPGTANDGAKVLDVYFDYSCHFCAAFEALHSPEITKLLKDGRLTLVLHPCKILGMEWTDMVMNAQGVVLDQAPEKSLDFHNQIFALFAQIYQAQDTSMMTVENIAKVATDAGVPEDVVSQIADAVSANAYGAWTELGTDTFTSHSPKFQGTPTVLLGGEELNLGEIDTADGLTKQLEA